MANNKGYEKEQQLLEQFSRASKISFRKLNGDMVEFTTDRIFSGGKTTRSKTDIFLSPAVRLQVKSTSSNRCAIVNMVPIRNIEKLGKREMMDVQPLFDIMDSISKNGNKMVFLKDHSNMNEWDEIVKYFLFEGTATAQTDKLFQANYLLDADAELTLISKTEAVPYLWKNLTAEIRYRKTKPDEPCLHIRY